jgi:hypothetical protein
MISQTTLDLNELHALEAVVRKRIMDNMLNYTVSLASGDQYSIDSHQLDVAHLIKISGAISFLQMQ